MRDELWKLVDVDETEDCTDDFYLNLVETRYNELEESYDLKLGADKRKSLISDMAHCISVTQYVIQNFAER